MGLSFRKAANIGPFRFNFSKSGIGASVGVKGARITRTASGTTYVTVGSHGFRYRETLSTPKHSRPQPIAPNLSQPQGRSDADSIESAGSEDLVDSSSERLIQQLNERASMFNPAWLLYAAAAMVLGGLAMLPAVPTMTTLPDTTSSLRNDNAVDEYPVLVARYGEPNSILFSEADPFAPIPVGTVQYDAAYIKVIFVPNGCLGVYNQVLALHAQTTASPSLIKKQLKSVPQCLPSPQWGWTITAYRDTIGGSVLTNLEATARLNSMVTRRIADPVVQTEAIPDKQKQLVSRRGANSYRLIRPDMKHNDQARLQAEQTKREIQVAGIRNLCLEIAVALSALGLLVTGILTHKKNSQKRQTNLLYDLDEAKKQAHEGVMQAVTCLYKSNCLWRIEGASATWDWKRNAGASSLVRRANIRAARYVPRRVTTNAEVPCIMMERSELYFLPDVVLYRDERGYGGIAYDDFKVTQSFTRFIEDGQVPSDAEVVGHTWRYVNKNGGPDRRFNNNRQMPILLLGVLTFSSSKGLNILLNTSNPQQSVAFADCWAKQFQRVREPKQSGTQSPPPPPRTQTSVSKETEAQTILGVKTGASQAEISIAYRHLAQKYHPDKVAGLAPEFQALADKRMKEINAAYELLKQKG